MFFINTLDFKYNTRFLINFLNNIKKNVHHKLKYFFYTFKVQLSMTLHVVQT